MTRLTDTQLVILSAACQRPNHIALPFPERLKGGAAQKVVAALLAKGLVEEVAAESDGPAWRTTADGQEVTLAATEAALEALGIAGPQGQREAPTAAMPAGESQDSAAPQAPPAGHTVAHRGKVREGTKQAQVIAMLRRGEGATIAQIVEATGWQPHTVRGAFAGALKKKLGLTISSEKVGGRGRVYRIEG